MSGRWIPTEDELAQMTPQELARAQVGGGTPRKRRRGIGPGTAQLPPLAQEAIEQAKAAKAETQEDSNK